MNERFEYLKNFKDRLLPLAVPYLLAIYSENNIKEYRKSKITNVTFFQLIHFILLFIEDKTIKASHCTKEDITNELKDIDEQYFKFDISNYEEVTQDIITYCIQNSGKGLNFPGFSPDESKYEDFQIKLVGDEFVKVNGKDVTSFYLTPQGLKYIYLTKELEDISEIEFNQIKLLKSIKVGNFKIARTNVDDLFYKIELQRKSVQYDKKRIISEIADLDIYEVFETTSQSYELISTQRRDNEDILKLIKEYHNLDKNKNIAMWQKVQKDIDDILYIERRLNSILDKQLLLIKDLQEQRDTLDEMLLDTKFLCGNNRLNILDDIIKPLEKDKTGQVNPFYILRGLFNFKFKQVISLQNVLSRHEILKDRNKECNSNLDVFVQDESVIDNSKIQEIMQYNNLYETVFIHILSKLEPNKELFLKDIITNNQFTLNIDATKVVLVSLFKEKEVHFEDSLDYLDIQSVDIFNPVSIAKKNGYSLGGKVLKIYTADNDILNIDSACDGPFKNILTVPNMVFLLERRDTHE